MKSLEVKCKKREAIGKKDSKKLRNDGFVPCVLYGGDENVHFAAAENDFRPLVYTPNVYIVKLDIGGDVYNAILQDIQFHPVTDKVIHMDFYRAYDDKALSIHVPIQLFGVPEGVKQGGKLALETRRIRVRALPGDLPDVIKVDVSKVGLGKSAKAGDLKLGNIQLLDSPNTVIASVKLTRAARGVGLAPGEEEEGEEGSEGSDSAAEEVEGEEKQSNS